MAIAGQFPKDAGDIWFKEGCNICANIITVEAGETIAADDVVYIHLTNGEAYVSDTGTSNDVRANGIALESGNDGDDIKIMTRGEWVTSGLTDKQDYYLGATGAISTTLSGVRIGTALSTTRLIIDIVQSDRDAIGTIKAIIPDFGGYPANNLTAFWNLMDGSTISDAESPLNGEVLKDINGTGRYLKGDDTSDTLAGSANTGGPSLTHTTNGAGGAQSELDTHTHPFTPKFHDVVFICKIK